MSTERSHDPGGVWTVVLGAGSSTRFGGSKQLAEVAGRSLLDRAVDTASAGSEGVVVVVPGTPDWERRDVAAVVRGGETRSRSVRAGLAAVPSPTSVVVIHDAAHPLAPRRLLEAVVAAVRAGADAAVPGLPVVEALRRVGDGWMGADVERTDLVRVQMPQAFAAGILRRVHAGEPESVEDSLLVRRAGGRVRVLPGDPGNLHVTTRADLTLARAIVRGSR